MKFITHALPLLMMAATLGAQASTSTQSGVRPDFKMVCKLSVIDFFDEATLLQSSIFRTTQSKVVVQGQAAEVAVGYERYKATLHHSQAGVTVRLYDGSELISLNKFSKLGEDFEVQAPIENRKFEKLALECGPTLGKTD